MLNNKLKIHENIYEKLDHFININQVPNILLHGPVGSGKRTIIFDFVNKIYKDKKDGVVLYVECGYGKGIKFIREEVNYFAKTNCNNSLFKTIVLLNADKLTIDAQSALRRSIELFCKTTRYFIILHDKNKLLNPLISRFCELFVPLPIINNKTINLHTYSENNDNFEFNNRTNKLFSFIKKTLIKYHDNITFIDSFNITEELYNKGISGLILIDYLVKESYLEDLILLANKLKCSIKNEKLLILSIINYIYFRSDSHINNILTN